MPSYDVTANPLRWKGFAAFVRNQILELVRDYGPIDCIWLDGGQVQCRNGLDIRIEEIVAEARKIQPWLIAAKPYATLDKRYDGAARHDVFKIDDKDVLDFL